MSYSESTYAYVRKRGKSWRAAPVEVVTLRASGLIDKEHAQLGNGVSVLRPAAFPVIEGAQCCRFRLEDGRIAAVTLAYAKGAFPQGPSVVEGGAA